MEIQSHSHVDGVSGEKVTTGEQTGYLKILVVDDSPTFREVMKDVLREFESVGLIKTAATGLEALEIARELEPHLIVLDIEMPGIDGIKTLRVLRHRVPNALVLIVSGLSDSGAALTVQAIDAGALDFICKPKGVDAQARLVANLTPYIRVAKRAAKLSLAHRVFDNAPEAAKAQGEILLASGYDRALALTPPIDLVIIGASTGAPSALNRIIQSLGFELLAPIVICVDLPLVFSSRMVEHLHTKTGRDIREVSEGSALVRNRILVASAEHPVVLRGTEQELSCSLEEQDNAHKSRQSPLDRLLHSAIERHLSGILVVLLTGSGTDGLVGSRLIKKNSRNYLVVQAPEDCVDPEVPEGAIKAGIVDEVIPLNEIGRRLTTILTASKTR